MARHSYPGLSSAREVFERLRPFRHELIQLKGLMRPFSPDYLILEAVDKALTTAAFHFTSDPEFYASKGHSC